MRMFEAKLRIHGSRKMRKDHLCHAIVDAKGQYDIGVANGTLEMVYPIKNRPISSLIPSSRMLKETSHIR